MISPQQPAAGRGQARRRNLIAVALSRFGALSGLQLIRSSSAANHIIAAICRLTNGQPGTVCSSTGVTAIGGSI